MNAFEQAMGVGSPIEMLGGPAEILSGYDGTDVGDRANMVADIDNPAKYLEGKYTIQDRIDLGFSQNPATIAPGATQLFTAVCSSPFKPLRFLIDSAVAADVSVMSVVIGSAIYVEGGPVPGAMYSEVSTEGRVSWRTVQTTVPIQIVIRNDSAAPVSCKLGLRGFRLV
jgi:hypothetical protein